MTDESELVCLGLDWSNVEEPQLRVARPGRAAPSFLVPVDGALRFRVSENDGRYCTGWFDLTGAESRHVVCENWEKVTRGRQCQRCQYREGFILAHQAHRSPGQLPENIREYLMQPHWLYLDVFADGSTKVGTVAQSRLASRLAEQGAVAARYVAHADDGIKIRYAESAVSAQFNLRQTLPTKRKLESLQSRVDIDNLQHQLDELALKVLPFLGSLDAGQPVRSVEPPRKWRLPSVAQTAFSCAPVVLYPNSLTTGDHSLYMKGSTGPISVFTAVDNDPEPVVYAVDLSSLQGIPITFGDFLSTVESVQTSLF